MKISAFFKFMAKASVVLFLLCGCASVGKDFKYQNVSSLELGQPQTADYKEMFGKPTTTLEKDTPEGKFYFTRYLFAHANLGSAKSRVLDLEFRDGVLNSYNYLSSFDDGKTTLNAEQVDQIKRGITNKAEVLQILGKPHGMAKCPSYTPDFKDKCTNGAEVWTWAVANKLSTLGSAFGGDRPEIHNIFIVFDKNGIVTEMTTTQTKN